MKFGHTIYDNKHYFRVDMGGHGMIIEKPTIKDKLSLRPNILKEDLISVLERLIGFIKEPKDKRRL